MNLLQRITDAQERGSTAKMFGISTGLFTCLLVTQIVNYEAFKSFENKAEWTDALASKCGES